MLTLESVDRHLQAFAARVERNAAFFDGRLPDYFDVAADEWRFDGFWTEGFWPGLLWLLASASESPVLTHRARRASARVVALKATMDDHDLGFLFHPSAVLPAQLLGEKEFLPAALAAAERLAARFRESAGYIPAHGPKDGPKAGFAIIDTAMNLDLLMWAARQTGEARLACIATTVARTIVREHERPDGSTCQVLWLDPRTGRTQGREAVMAATVDSCWARGQAWGIYGIAQAAEATDDAELRAAAVRMARYFLQRLPADGVTFHDLDDPAIPHVPKDTSAQAIAAGGLLILARLARSATEVEKWRTAAGGLLSVLLRDHLAPAGSAGRPRGLLTNACKSLRKNQGVVSEIIFGDYYLVEALLEWRRQVGGARPPGGPV